jgi:hypothetical protein
MFTFNMSMLLNKHVYQNVCVGIMETWSSTYVGESTVF